MNDPGFFQYLRTVTQVTALVGEKIYPVRAPQGADRPFVVWFRSDVERQNMYCGASELVKGRYQFSCYASTYDDAMEVHRAVKGALQDFSGLMGDALVRNCHCTSDFASADEDPATHCIVQLWDVWFLENEG